MAHCQEKGWNFLIRVRDGRSSMKESFDLPQTECFDQEFHLALTRRQTKETKNLFQNRNHFKFIPNNQRFDFLSKQWDRTSPPEWFHLHFRMVRLEIVEGKYETLVTNTDYPLEKLKNLYASRWGIETSFRDLKYSMGLVSFHSKKIEGIFQEIYACLTMYNYSRMILSQVLIPKTKTKHAYQASFTDAIYACRLYFNQKMTSTQLKTYVIHHLSPIRPNRQAKRKIKSQTVVDFTYRIA